MARNGALNAGVTGVIGVIGTSTNRVNQRSSRIGNLDKNILSSISLQHCRLLCIHDEGR